MCVKTLIPKKNKDRIINKITKNGKKVYKAVRVIDGKYYPLFQNYNTPYNEGVMDADQEAMESLSWRENFKQYKAGFHFWLHKKDADTIVKDLRDSQGRSSLRKQFVNGEFKVIQCIVKKSWVNILGIDETMDIEGKVLVAKRAIFPKFRK